MFPHPDTLVAVCNVERALTLKNAERRALLLEAAKRSDAGPKPAPVVPIGTPRVRLASVLGFLRHDRRPATA